MYTYFTNSIGLKALIKLARNRKLSTHSIFIAKFNLKINPHTGQHIRVWHKSDIKMQKWVNLMKKSANSKED